MKIILFYGLLISVIGLFAIGSSVDNYETVRGAEEQLNWENNTINYSNNDSFIVGFVAETANYVGRTSFLTGRKAINYGYENDYDYKKLLDFLRVGVYFLLFALSFKPILILSMLCVVIVSWLKKKINEILVRYKKW